MSKSKAEMAQKMERMAWELEDLALALDERAAATEWAKQWRERGNPTLNFDPIGGHYKLRNTECSG